MGEMGVWWRNRLAFSALVELRVYWWVHWWEHLCGKLSGSRLIGSTLSGARLSAWRSYGPDEAISFYGEGRGGRAASPPTRITIGSQRARSAG